MRHTKGFIISIILLGTVFQQSVLAQYAVSGKVIDQGTKTPLAFVNIVANNERHGTSTDIDGRFALSSPSPITNLSLSYVGYEPMEVNANGTHNGMVIEMVEKSFQLREVEIYPGENPAHRIVDLVFANRKVNHGQRRVSFSYKSYSKFVMTTELDSAIANNPEKISELDSSDTDLFEWAETHHLFMMESVTERNYKPPDRDHETVLATRVSGLKDPSFLALAAQTKTFSFYEPTINVQDKSYLSPISRGSTDQYLFIIEDTLWNKNDTVFVLSFKPRTGKKFDGMKGLLYINSDGYAIQNVIAEPIDRESGFNLKVQQMHEKVQGRQWFPVQQNSFVYFDALQVNDFSVVGIGRTYLKEIEIEPELRAKDLRGPEIEVMEGANIRKEEFWDQYRNDTLSVKDANTYHFMDSLGSELKFDRKLKTLEAVLTGVIPYKFIELDLNRIMTINGYESFRLGLGVHTNRRFSKLFKVGGYGAYGFKDDQWKYGFDGSLIIDWRKEMEFNVSYENDVLESGGVKFKGDRKPFSSEYYRQFYINRMDRYDKVQATFSFRALEHFKFWFFMNEQQRQTTNDYRYLNEPTEGVTLEQKDFYFTEAGVSIRFAYNERLATTMDRVFVLGTKAPILYMNITKGFDNLGKGEYDYWKFDLKFEKKFHMARLGEPSFQLLMGYVDRDLPYTQLYNMRGTYAQFNIAVAGSFETMRVNEFLGDQYAALFLRHNFKDLLIEWGKFRPQFQLVTNIGIGSLRDPERHNGIEFSTMEKGYFESGLHIDNLLRSGIVGLGIGAFYRYGPYVLPNSEDNLALKFTFEFTL